MSISTIITVLFKRSGPYSILKKWQIGLKDCHLELLVGESGLLGVILGLMVQYPHLVPFSQNLQQICTYFSTFPRGTNLTDQSHDNW
jgi:hypothetical protein